MQLLKSLVISALHRLGVFGYLREHWRRDDAGARRRLDALEDATDKLGRSIEGLPALGNRVQLVTEHLDALERHVRTLRLAVLRDQSQQGTRWNRLDATLDPASIQASIARAFAAAEFDDTPMPHLVLRNLWPADTYDGLLEAIPADEFFRDRDPIKQNLKIKHVEIAPAWTRRALEFLENTAIPDILTPALVTRMRPYLEEVYRAEYGPSVGPRLAALPHRPTAGRLMLRRPGYRLEPHLDPRRVVFTCLLYFARPGDDTAYGTQLFAIDRPVVLDRKNTFYPREHGYECRPVKTVPFEPNTALVFLNRVGAHAAEIPRDAPPDTRRFSYQFYVSPDPDAVDALVRDNQATPAHHDASIANHA